MIRLVPLPEIIVVLAIATIIFGPRALWRMRRRHRMSRLAD